MEATRPAALLGPVFFVALLVLCLPPLWGRPQTIYTVRVVAATVGVLSALYLVYIELFKADKICLYCTGVHGLTLVLLGIVLAAPAFAEDQ